ncbi:BlaI/MecI/CopY family transcriptional regulator [Propionibacteriaceae bacterium G1746]
MLGDLESAIMDVLWASREPLSVRVVFEQLSADRQLAYTTVMTVLDRLAKKGTVLREQQGRAWIYRPSETRSAMIVGEMQSLLDQAGDEANLVLAQLVERLQATQREHVARVLNALPAAN